MGWSTSPGVVTILEAIPMFITRSGDEFGPASPVTEHSERDRWRRRKAVRSKVSCYYADERCASSSSSLSRRRTCVTRARLTPKCERGRRGFQTCRSPAATGNIEPVSSDHDAVSGVPLAASEWRKPGSMGRKRFHAFDVTCWYQRHLARRIRDVYGYRLGEPKGTRTIWGFG